MREILLEDAEARLLAVVDAVVNGEEFTITRHGRKDAVMMSWAAWQRLSNVPSFGRLLAASPLEDGDLPERTHRPARNTDLQPIASISVRLWAPAPMMDALDPVSPLGITLRSIGPHSSRKLTLG